MSIRRCTEQHPNPPKCESFEETYEGAVLATYERNWHDDSDFYAIVWDEEAGAIKHVEYASTRGWTYHHGATVDATEDAKDKAERKLAEDLYAIALGSTHERASAVAIGKRVRSTTKRGKNVGLTGEVRWMQEQRSQYGTWSRGWRIGIRPDDAEGNGLRFMNADAVEVLDPEPVDEVAVRRQAEAHAASMRAAGRWRYATRIGGQIVEY